MDNSQEKSVVETTVGIRKEISNLSTITGISSKKLTSLLLMYAIEKAKKDPTIITVQITKSLKTA